MNQYINSARAVEKIQTTNIQAFNSGEAGYLGYIFDGNVYQLNKRREHLKMPLPKKLTKVDLFIDYAGADGDFIRLAVKKGAKGIVIESLGVGNVNAPVFEAIRYALAKKVIVVISSRVIFGSVFPIYGGKGGGETLQNIGAIVTGNLSGPKARLLLMLALSSFGPDKSKIEKLFSQL